MAHYCECRRRIVVKSRARHARAGWSYRSGHDLCRKCWRSLVERQATRRIALLHRTLPVFDGFKPDTTPQNFTLTLTVLAYKSGDREARSN